MTSDTVDLDKPVRWDKDHPARKLLFDEITCGRIPVEVHYAKSYRPFELFVNENYKL